MSDSKRFRPTSGARLAALSGAVITIFTACADRSETLGPLLTTRDSAGIRIVENHVPMTPSSAGLSLSAEPRVRIGAVEGDESEQLFGVLGGAVLPDGRIALLNSGTREVRIYDAAGRHLITFGGTGDGPGEFRRPEQLAFIEPDTLMVWDDQTWRTTRFDLNGNVVAEDAGRTKYGRIIPEGMRAAGGFAMPGGGLVLRAYGQSVYDRPRYRVLRPDFRLLYLPAAGDTAVTLWGEYGGFELMLVEESGRPRAVQVPFGRFTAWTVGGDPPMIWAGNNERFELRGYDGTGHLVRLLRSDARPRPVTSDDFERYVQWIRERMSSVGSDPDEIQAYIRRLDLVPLPAAMPHYSSIHASRDGSLWVAEFQEVSEDLPRTYHVFDPEGRWIGAVETPASFELLDTGQDYVLGKVTDELGVEYVVLHDLSGGE